MNGTALRKELARLPWERKIAVALMLNRIGMEMRAAKPLPGRNPTAYGAKRTRLGTGRRK
jgi:hypothetical protein